MEQKKKKEKAISNTGCQMFNGTLSLQLWSGKEVKVRCEYFGLDLQRASQEHQLVMLIKQHLPYDELDTGWLVRTKEMDKDHQFGLKARKSDRHWAVYNYNDVVAWGYADGGLNNDHFKSCQLRPEDYPEYAGQPEGDTGNEYEYEENEVQRRCVKLRYQDGEIYYNAIQAADEPMERGGTPLMHDCAKAFYAFREEHPEVTEIHFYTDEEVKMGKNEGNVIFKNPET